MLAQNPEDLANYTHYLEQGLASLQVVMREFTEAEIRGLIQRMLR